LSSQWPAMTSDEPYDVAVLGMGPAGLGAAIEASRSDLRVLGIDEAPEAGGQIYRASPPGFRLRNGTGSPESRAGDRLRRELEASAVETAFRHRIWSVQDTSGRFQVETVAPSGLRTYHAYRLVIATGANERVGPVPGWTMPGVIGLAGASRLLKADHILPGYNVVLAGNGPLLLAVAVSIIKGGGRVSAIVDQSSRAEWLRALPGLMSSPDVARRGLKWSFDVRRAGVPLFYGYGVRRVLGERSVEGVEITQVDHRGAPVLGGKVLTLQTDCVALGNGLVPATEITRLLRLKHVSRPLRGGWLPECDAAGRTSDRRIFAVGDCAGIFGGRAAEHAGRLTGLELTSAVHRDDTLRRKTDRRKLQSSLRATRRTGDAVARLMRPRDGALDFVTPETIVCRCEDVIRSEIEEASSDGAFDVNQLKAWTRCGMGPCQGRMCSETVSALFAARSEPPAGSSLAGWTSRPPIRPLSVDLGVGNYTLDDIKPPVLGH